MLHCAIRGPLCTYRQIVDSGLDETHCHFVDEDGKEVEHGYFFDELSVSGSSSTFTYNTEFTGGYFPFDISRRKVKKLGNSGRSIA